VHVGPAAAGTADGKVTPQGRSNVPRRVTSVDIARSLGLSQATVSYVLSGRGREVGVSEGTCRRVEARARELGYRANRLARGLKEGCSRTIGVVAPCVTFAFFSQIVRGAEAVFSANGYVTLLTHTDEDAQREREKLDVLCSYPVDGLLIVPAVGRGGRQPFARLVEEKWPFVLVDKEVRGLKAPFVGSDDRAGARAVVEHLVSLGHRRIGFLCGPRTASTARARFAGYRAALVAHGLAVDESLVAGNDWSVQEGETAARKLLALRRPPTTIFACTDVSAMGVYRAAAARGLTIPRDLSVAGYADLECAALLNPPLTTVQQPAEELGRRAAEMLLAIIAGRSKPRPRLILPVQLVLRGSCARPA